MIERHNGNKIKTQDLRTRSQGPSHCPLRYLFSVTFSVASLRFGNKVTSKIPFSIHREAPIHGCSLLEDFHSKHKLGDRDIDIKQHHYFLRTHPRVVS
eukprot:scaffold1595_cov171-Amphora_coffeaeformis.AAC.10